MPFADQKKRSTSPQQREDEPTPKRPAIPTRVFLDAAISGNLEKIKECINYGVDKEAKDDDGDTALLKASSRGHLLIVKYLLATCHVDKGATNNRGYNALHKAICNHHLDIVKYLIDEGHINKDMKSYNGQTMLHMACGMNCKLQSVQFLIETCQVDTNATCNFGETALHVATHQRRLDIVKYLIETCHVDMEQKDTFGLSAFDYVQRCNVKHIFDYMKARRTETTLINDFNEENRDTVPDLTTDTPQQSADNIDLVDSESETQNLRMEIEYLKKLLDSKCKDTNESWLTYVDYKRSKDDETVLTNGMEHVDQTVSAINSQESNHDEGVTMIQEGLKNLKNDDWEQIDP